MTDIFITIATMKTILRGNGGMGSLSPDSTYQEHGHYPLIDEIPPCDTETEKISSEDVVDEINKVVTRVYTVTPLTTEELQARYKATVPVVITMRQGRLALLNVGLLTTVTDAITGGTDEALKIEWEYATEMKRDWPSLVAMATALGMTEADIDNLFIGGALL